MLISKKNSDISRLALKEFKTGLLFFKGLHFLNKIVVVSCKSISAKAKPLLRKLGSRNFFVIIELLDSAKQ